MQKRSLFDYVTGIFILLYMLVIAIIIISSVQFDLEDRVIGEGSKLDEGWYRVYEDGSREKVDRPVVENINNGEWATFETELPSVIEPGTVLGLFSYRDAYIYIDGDLRASFTNDANPFPGKNVKNCFTEIRLTEEDQGKVLRISKEAVNKNVNVTNVYYGDTYGVVRQILSKYGIQFFGSSVLFVVSIVFVIFSIIIMGKFEEWKLLFSLGVGFASLSLWDIIDSLLFQFIFGTYYIDGVWGYLVTMIFIFPFLYLVNYLQRRRYETYASFVAIVYAINFALISYLHFSGTIDFNASRFAMNMVVALGIIYILASLGIDIAKGYGKEYKNVIIGIFGLALSGIAEVLNINFFLDKTGGLVLLAGTYFLLLMSVIEVFRQIRRSQDRVVAAVEANVLKSEFLANMSHEIRTPINAIMGMNELILRENHNEEIKEYATNIQHASNNLLTIINDILDFSKIESGKMELVKSDYSLMEVLDDVVTMLKIKAEDKNLSLVSKIDGNTPDKLYGDEGKVRQIIVNILNNAVKYTNKGTVTLSVSGTRFDNVCRLVIKVKDTGIGIKDADIDSIFDKFSRADTNKNRTIEGTGLGLAITKTFVDMMTGSIEVESRYGKGTEFTVVLPQTIKGDETIDDVIKTRENDHKNDSKENDEVKFTGASVLVVDDVDMNLAVMEGLLKNTGLDVSTALSGEICLELIKKNKYDLIFMDHMMPEMDGVETLQHIREDKDHPNQDTPVIVLTANAIVGAEEEYREAGFADYLSKPIDSSKLNDMTFKYLKDKCVRE